MSNITRGMVAGFAATLALSAIMVMKSIMGLMPELDVIAMLSGMMGTSATGGWIAHFVIGTVLFGIGFALMFHRIPGDNPVIKGILFATGAWLVMMIAVMPMAGAGMFGLSLGIMAPVMTFMLHLIYGAVLGFTYARAVTTPAHLPA